MLRAYIANICIICYIYICICCEYINCYVANIEMYVFYKFGANGAVPAGAFFPAEIALVYFLRTENIDFCMLNAYICVLDTQNTYFTSMELMVPCPQGLFPAE